jgi:hypothetical protein
VKVSLTFDIDVSPDRWDLRRVDSFSAYALDDVVLAA